MEVAIDDGYLLVVTTNGFGKRTKLSEYPAKGRATKGVKTIDQRAMPEIGLVAASRVVKNDDEVIFITSGGIVLRSLVRASGPADALPAVCVRWT